MPTAELPCAPSTLTPGISSMFTHIALDRDVPQVLDDQELEYGPCQEELIAAEAWYLLQQMQNA